MELERGLCVLIMFLFYHFFGGPGSRLDVVGVPVKSHLKSCSGDSVDVDGT